MPGLGIPRIDEGPGGVVHRGGGGDGFGGSLTAAGLSDEASQGGEVLGRVPAVGGRGGRVGGGARVDGGVAMGGRPGGGHGIGEVGRSKEKREQRVRRSIPIREEGGDLKR